ncbi:MAG: InlB B-repeat-containing protein [Methanosarcinales archaeon]|nr:InlB B-repeat-containing protein [Methanosarcinales archaeon]
MAASILILLAASCISIAADGGFGGGGGSLEDPFLIEDAADFKAIQKNLSAHYKLVNDINLFGSGFDPIGSKADPFTGSLTGGTDEIDGEACEISNFEYDGTNQVALFNYAENAQFSDLVLRNIEITTTGYRSGALAGEIYNTTVTNCALYNSELIGHNYISLIGHANNSTISDCLSENIIIRGAVGIAGILGHGNNTTVTNCHADGTLYGKQEVGGLVGTFRSGIIDGSSSSCVIHVISEPVTSPVEPYHIGGLVGLLTSSDVRNSFAAGSIDSLGDYTGGLVGRVLAGNITNCYATGDIDCTNNYVGGLVGHFLGSGNISNSWAESRVNGIGYTGGLVGCVYDGNISNSSVGSGTAVTGAGVYTGGLAGRVDFSNITDCSAAGSVESTTSDVGGLAGRSLYSNISNCSAENIVDGTDSIGGLIGFLYQSNLSKGSVAGDTEVTGNNYVGGLAGCVQESNISQSSVTGNAVVSGGMGTGGLVGYSQGNNISKSYVAGDAEVMGSVQITGGLIGYMLSTSLSQSFMAGDVSGTGSYIGGLAGMTWNDGSFSSISDCYVTGDVLGTGSYVGGLVGRLYEGGITNTLALNEYVMGSASIGRLYGYKDAGSTFSDSYAWINMSDGSALFADSILNVTSAEVWRKYPSSGWETSGFGGDWELNTYGDFLLPVHAWTDKNIAANGTHLIPKYYVTYNGNGYTSGTVPVDVTVYLDRLEPETAIISDAGDMGVENFVFNNWNTEADGSGVFYEAGDSRIMDSNVTLYAQWAEVPYTPGGGSGTGSATVADPFGSAQVVDPVQPGYETPVEPEPTPEIIVILFFMIAVACYLFVTRAEIEKENG